MGARREVFKFWRKKRRGGSDALGRMMSNERGPRPKEDAFVANDLSDQGGGSRCQER